VASIVAPSSEGVALVFCEIAFSTQHPAFSRETFSQVPWPQPSSAVFHKESGDSWPGSE